LPNEEDPLDELPEKEEELGVEPKEDEVDDGLPIIV